MGLIPLWVNWPCALSGKIVESASSSTAWGSAAASLLLVPCAGSPSIPEVDTLRTWALPMWDTCVGIEPVQGSAGTITEGGNMGAGAGKNSRVGNAS